MTSHGARLAWLLAATLLLTPGVAFAGQNPGIAFKDRRALKLTPDSPEAMRTVVVCNVSDVEALEPVAVLSTFQKGTDPPVELMTAKVTGDKDDRKWQAGDCRNVVLAMADGVTVAAGSYAGLLTVHTSVALARRRVMLTGPSEVSKPTPAKSVSDPAKLTAKRAWPGKAAGLDDPAQLLLVAAAPGQTLTVPRDCPKSRPTIGTKPCPFIGNLVNGHQVAKVYVAGGLTENQNQPAKLKLRMTRATSAGTYTGKVDLAQTPTDPADDIALTVTVKDAWWCAVLALLLGAVIAFCLQYGVRTSWPKRRLRVRYRNFEADYTSAVAAFNKKRPKGDGLQNWSPPTATAIDDVNKDIETGIKRYRNSTVYWDDTSEGYKELDSSLAQVEDDIDCLRDKARLADGLKKLKTALDDLATFLEDKYRAPRAPAFVGPATALLKGPKPAEGETVPGPLAVGQGLTTLKSAKAETALIASWTDVAEDILEYDAWWDRLAKKQQQDPGNWSASDKESLIDAAARLAVARHELLAVEDADDFAELDTKRDLHRAYEKLASLSAVHGGWPGEVDVDANVRSLAMEDLEIGGAFAEDFGYSDLTYALATWLGEAAEWASDPATAAKLRAIGGVLMASLILVVTVVMAVLTGLAAFWIGKDTWGTPEDYFTVIVIGAAAQVLVQAVVDVVNKLLAPAPKQLITGPSAAVLKPPTATATTS